MGCGFRTLWKRSEEHTSELQSQSNLVCRLLLEKKNKIFSTDSSAIMHEEFDSIFHSLILTHAISEQHLVAVDTYATDMQRPYCLLVAHRPSIYSAPSRTSGDLLQPAVEVGGLARENRSSGPAHAKLDAPRARRSGTPFGLSKRGRALNPLFFFLSEPAPTKSSPLPHPAALPF